MLRFLASGCPWAIWLCVNVAFAHPFHARGDGTHVSIGQSIQAAIDAAQAGTTITVGPGSYAEQLTIMKDGISLVGDGAVLVPPAVAVQNTCTGVAGNQTGAGICIAGSGVQLAPFVSEHEKVLSVAEPVRNVSISGFRIDDFDGGNIMVVGGDNVRVSGNSLYNGHYGFLSDGSTNTVFTENTVVSEGSIRFIAICNDNPSGAQVTHNHAAGYITGLCIQTSGADVSFNDVTGSCIGAFVDPGIVGAQVTHNNIGATDPNCATASPANGGIFIYGAVNSTITSNVIHDQHAGGMAAGIILVDATDIDPGLIASGNRVSDNILLQNDFDIFVNTTGTGNVVLHNQCSTPATFCG